MKKIITALTALCLMAGAALSLVGCSDKNVSTETDGKTVALPDKTVYAPDGDSYSIITKLDLNVKFDNNIAKATVKNSFTLFPAKAQVYVYLYFAEIYTTDYTKMQEVANNYIKDLDMNKTLTATYEMQGESGYFLARMRYKIDSRNWEERTTDAYKRDYNGIFMQTIEDDGSLPVFEDLEPVLPIGLFLNGYERIYSKSFFYIGFQPDDMTCKKFEDENIKKFNETIGKEFYVFNPKDNVYSSYANHIGYSIERKNDFYVLNKCINLDVPKFGFSNPPEPGVLTGLGRWNIYFNLHFIAVNNLNLNGKLKLKFGKCEKEYNNAPDKFINLYIGNECIGTCFYKAETVEEVTYAFFYNLFAEGLRII